MRFQAMRLRSLFFGLLTVVFGALLEHVRIQAIIVQHESAKQIAESKLADIHDRALACDRALVTAVAWQARVSLAMDAFTEACVK